MIYYPLSVFMQAEIKDILIISSKKIYQSLKTPSDGTDLGLKISLRKTIKPNGIAESFIIGKNFIGDDNVSLILGDNIFHGKNFISNIE